MQAAYAQTHEPEGSAPPGTSHLTVTSQLENGTEVTGYYTELGTVDSTTGEFVMQQLGFTPATFTLQNGQDYTLGVADFLNIVFAYWLDNNSTDRFRTVNISADTQLTAVYMDTQQQGEETTGGEGEENNNPPPPPPPPSDPPATGETSASGGVTYSYVQQLAKKAAVFVPGISAEEGEGEGDASFAPASVPDVNLSGYVLPDGSQISDYSSIYELLASGMDLSTTIRAAEMAGIDWSSLSEAQQCYLMLVLNINVPLDENGLPL